VTNKSTSGAGLARPTHRQSTQQKTDGGVHTCALCARSDMVGSILNIDRRYMSVWLFPRIFRNQQRQSTGPTKTGRSANPLRKK
jgi:hypothetical protein